MGKVYGGDEIAALREWGLVPRGLTAEDAADHLMANAAGEVGGCGRRGERVVSVAELASCPEPPLPPTAEVAQHQPLSHAAERDSVV